MSSIFLSHSHKDKSFARKLAADLRAGGHDVWIDEAEINIGDSLIEKIREGLDSVDYVVAILSSNSIRSEWVNRELDIASNREIDEKRVIVLPLLIDKVPLPGFLRGKFYGDFTEERLYQDTLNLLLRKLGPVRKMPDLSAEDIERLRAELEDAKKAVAQHKEDLERHRKAALHNKSEKLVKAIEEANQKFPEHAPINTTYAFELGNTSITLDYVLWTIGKARREGSHPIELLLSLENRWGEIDSMLEAYADLLDATDRS